LILKGVAWAMKNSYIREKRKSPLSDYEQTQEFILPLRDDKMSSHGPMLGATSALKLAYH